MIYRVFLLLGLFTTALSADDWRVDTAEDWAAAVASSDGLVIEEGSAAPEGEAGSLQTVVKFFEMKQKASVLTIEQSAIWQNWQPIDNLGPSNLGDAPVLLTMGPDDYWMFGRYTSGRKRPKKGQKPTPLPPFTPEAAELEGFEGVELQTTRFPNQYNAPGGLEKGLGGYHAWQSRDMVNWVHHGPVTEKFSCWVTTAEQKDGQVYIYYDYPNDQDPHLYIDSDLTDGKPGENKGMAFADPTHGSDCAFIRDLDGRFHVIYEDWSPINASKRSWDSPIAGHAVSADGEGDFEILDPAVDNRTTPTGEKLTYQHPHWLQHPDFDSNLGEYEVHSPEQEAYGDWAAICIGGQYYLFGDYDPAGGHEMATGWFTSPSLDQEFVWCDKIGKGHPDPDVCFAEGQFYLATQQKTDYVSPGPWVEKVTARVGVDTDGDKAIDQWTNWAEVKESYDYIEGQSKQVSKTPATLDVSALPAGFGYQVELKVEDTTENKSKPIVEALVLGFE